MLLRGNCEGPELRSSTCLWSNLGPRKRTTSTFPGRNRCFWLVWDAHQPPQGAWNDCQQQELGLSRFPPAGSSCQPLLSREQGLGRPWGVARWPRDPHGPQTQPGTHPQWPCGFSDTRMPSATGRLLGSQLQDLGTLSPPPNFPLLM